MANISPIPIDKLNLSPEVLALPIAGPSSIVD